MKKAIAVIFLGFILLTNLCSQESKEHPLELSFHSVALSDCSDRNEYYQEYYKKTYSNLYGVINLTNTTDTTFTFWTMTCSWTDLIILKPDTFMLWVKECDSNYPKRITLEKEQSVSFNSVIEIPSSVAKDGKWYTALTDTIDDIVLVEAIQPIDSFKIGWILIEDNEFRPSEIFKKEGDFGREWQNLIESKKKNDVIWSNPINIWNNIYRWKINKAPNKPQ
ncbi:hypothetical protein [Carboxylicivirga marina]|uniref:hypothetical protein n=1 Tax=Carboxylicivirga marina TaxID=2800988 RepID=UPI002596431A|nr:hypothetical protein [uncultured Carboxylicivirga sp.]